MADQPDVDATPTAIEHAQATGVDLTTVEGTGAGGRITKADVVAVASETPEQQQSRVDELRAKHDDLAVARDQAANELVAAEAEIPVDEAKVAKAQAKLDAANKATWEAEAELVAAQEGLDKPPVVLAFGCDNCEVATFIGEKRAQGVGAPAIPRDVRCPVCGAVMPLRQPFGLSAVPATAPA